MPSDPDLDARDTFLLKMLSAASTASRDLIAESGLAAPKEMNKGVCNNHAYQLVYAGCVHFSGRHDGWIALTSDAGVVQTLCQSMYGVDDDDINEHVRLDLIGEFCNVLAGRTVASVDTNLRINVPIRYRSDQPIGRPPFPSRHYFSNFSINNSTISTSVCRA